MKIVATLADTNMYLHLGGEVVRHSVVIEIPDENVPEMVRRYLEKGTESGYQSMSFSRLVEEAPDEQV